MTNPLFLLCCSHQLLDHIRLAVDIPEWWYLCPGCGKHVHVSSVPSPDGHPAIPSTVMVRGGAR